MTNRTCMSVDTSRNKEAVQDKYNLYLNVMLGEGSLAYREFVDNHFFTRSIRKRKLEQILHAMQTQRDIVLDYAEACLTCEDDADIERDVDTVLQASQQCDDINTEEYVERFLDTNPFLTQFSINPDVREDVKKTMTDHFFYLADELTVLLDTDVSEDVDDVFGALVQAKYDTFDEAQNALKKNLMYTDKLLEYQDDISLGWAKLVTTTTFSDDIWPVLKKGEQELGGRIEEELRDIYA